MSYTLEEYATVARMVIGPVFACVFNSVAIYIHHIFERKVYQ